RRRHLRQGAGFLHAGIAAGMRLQRQDLPERMRRASRQGGDRLHRRLQETARGARHAGGKTRGKKEARKGRQGNEGRQAETEAGPGSVTLVKASLARAFAASSAGKSLPGAFAGGRCFHVIYLDSNISPILRINCVRGPGVETARLRHAVKNAWSMRI